MVPVAPVSVMIVGLIVSVGDVVSRTYVCALAVLKFPAASSARTCSVLLPVSVAPLREKVVLPVVAVAVCHVAPLLRETLMTSPLARAALSVPLIVCEAVLVIKSELLVPVSAENATVETRSVGGVVSTVAVTADVVVVLPALSVAVAVKPRPPSRSAGVV
jgi:hypothetical protein